MTDVKKHFPLRLCHHLQSKEDDKSCPCGYRGSVWSADGEHVIFEVGESKSELMQPPLERDELTDVIREIVRRCNSYDDLLKQVEWQPIETAPRTGERILLAVEGFRKSNYGHWYSVGNRFVYDGYDFGNPTKQPTHWRKLPDTPKKEK